MKTQPITIRVSKGYATFIYILILACTIYGIASIPQSFNGANNISGSLALLLNVTVGFAISAIGIWSLFTKAFIYDTKAQSAGSIEPIITVTDNHITCTHPSQDQPKTIRWDEINLIRVFTTDQGPYVCDVFFAIHSFSDEVILVPQDNIQANALLDKIMKFPGFDFKLFTEAMSCSDEARFTVWEKA